MLPDHSEPHVEEYYSGIFKNVEFIHIAFAFSLYFL